MTLERSYLPLLKRHFFTCILTHQTKKMRHSVTFFMFILCTIIVDNIQNKYTYNKLINITTPSWLYGSDERL